MHLVKKVGFISSLIFVVPSVPARQATQAPAVLASAEHEIGGVKVELLEVKRDTPRVVTLRWRYRNETGEPKQLTKQRTGSIDAYRLSLNSYLLDENKRIKYTVSRDTNREPVASRNGGANKYIVIAPNATIDVWAKYLVPEASTKVTAVIEGVSPFSGIDISR